LKVEDEALQTVTRRISEAAVVIVVIVVIRCRRVGVSDISPGV
jgi:hypothetical protein